ncbi:MAG TPA: excinuclease ABC subunit UvrA [Candidatus Sulfotelmatobacter sp.]|nr:excinuclease ABC subunit UvrA [Candidatus Sulfotelmatobacter sp.]
MSDSPHLSTQQGRPAQPIPRSDASQTGSSAQAGDSIVVRGARVHNLKNIDFEVPHNSLTVVTGVSGSGKSSLAFDTIYAEGQRRYVESLSAYARQFLERIEKPDADRIDGIAPAVAIRQKNTTRNPRSTVATATEIYDYLRLLFARVGQTYCANCGREVKKDTVDEVADTILALDPDTRLQVLFPLQRPAQQAPEATAKAPRPTRKAPPFDKLRAGFPAKNARNGAPGAGLTDALKTRLFDLRKAGFNRLYQAGQIFEFSTPESLLDLDFGQPVFVLVDRLTVSAEARSRVVDAIETAYRESGEVIFEMPGAAAEVETTALAAAKATPKAETTATAKATTTATATARATAADKSVRPTLLRFAQRFECKNCNLRYEEPEPRLFSFNNPYGACPRCQGFGNTIDFDLDLVIPDKTKTLGEGAIEPWTKPKYRPLLADLKRYAKQAEIPLDVPWAELEEEQRNLVLNGEGRFLGVRGFFSHLERKKYKLHVRVFLSRYRGYSLCPDCSGSRLRLEARQVRINGRNICEVCALTVEDAFRFFETLELSAEQADIADKLLQEIRERLRFLNDVGLEYLTLDRLSSTLSGGEAQRIQLATSLGSRLVGTLYVLDEPSIGLHPRDTHRLIRILHDLRDLGNTILVVEHDPDIMQAADRILDLGPGAGENGGKLVAAGTYDEILHTPVSLTGRYLAHDLRIQPPVARRKPGTQQIRIRGVRANNLKGVDISIPLGLIVAITGVSGSGKSTLLHQVLYRALAQAKGQSSNGATGPTVSWQSLEGDQFIDEVVLVDQSPIGRTPRSNPVTYIKAFDAIRELFASLPEAQKRGFGAGHFSFNIPGGRCETCQGDGTVTVEMQFLADVELICEECKGTRYKPQVLEVRYRGKNIHDVLNLTVKEALKFFAEAPRVTEKLRSLEEVGLGYLRLGQSATTLSGGEAQRMKLAAHLQPASRESSRSGRGAGDSKPRQRVLYIFDEPTTGLHFDDVSKLLAAFRRLIEVGGSIVVIEHNLEVIKTADWVIDLGPEGGNRGGKVVGVGPPEAIAKLPGSYTGKYLARILSGNGNSPSNGHS